MFEAKEEMLDENSLFELKSPYAAGKVFSHNLTSFTVI